MLGGCGALCPCPETPEYPEPQGPLSGLVVTSHDQYGKELPPPVEPEGGSIEVTGREVIVRYTQGSVAHQLVYAITGPR